MAKIATACGVSLGYAPALQLSFSHFPVRCCRRQSVVTARNWFLDAGAAGARDMRRPPDQLSACSRWRLCHWHLPWTFELVHDAVARTAMIGFGAVAGALIFLLMGRVRVRSMGVDAHLSAASESRQQCANRHARSATSLFDAGHLHHARLLLHKQSRLPSVSRRFCSPPPYCWFHGAI